MSTEITTFDYQALPSECALEVRAVAERIHKRTAIAIIENGKDLLAVREMPAMKRLFRRLAESRVQSERTNGLQHDAGGREPR